MSVLHRKNRISKTQTSTSKRNASCSERIQRLAMPNLHLVVAVLKDHFQTLNTNHVLNLENLIDKIKNGKNGHKHFMKSLSAFGKREEENIFSIIDRLKDDDCETDDRKKTQFKSTTESFLLTLLRENQQRGNSSPFRIFAEQAAPRNTSIYSIGDHSGIHNLTATKLEMDQIKFANKPLGDCVDFNSKYTEFSGKESDHNLCEESFYNLEMKDFSIGHGKEKEDKNNNESSTESVDDIIAPSTSKKTSQTFEISLDRARSSSTKASAYYLSTVKGNSLDEISDIKSDTTSDLDELDAIRPVRLGRQGTPIYTCSTEILGASGDKSVKIEIRLSRMVSDISINCKVEDSTIRRKVYLPTESHYDDENIIARLYQALKESLWILINLTYVYTGFRIIYLCLFSILNIFKLVYSSVFENIIDTGVKLMYKNSVFLDSRSDNNSAGFAIPKVVNSGERWNRGYRRRTEIIDTFSVKNVCSILS